MIASATLIAQRDFRRARAILGDDSHIVSRVKLLFHILQFRGEAGRARLLGAEERFEIGELALDGENARRRAFSFSADQNRTANDVAVERDECRLRPLLRAIDRLLKIADDVRLWNRAANSIGDIAFTDDGVKRITPG